MGYLHCVGFLLLSVGANLWCVSGRLCYFEQEPDPDQRGKLRWVLPLEQHDLCSCSEIRPGGVNMVIPKRAFQPYYTEQPFFTDNKEILHDYFKCHGDCEAKLQAGYSSGVYTIYPPQFPDGLRVYCKMKSYGWIVFQRRFMNGTLNFNQTWAEYSKGFGILTGEFWLGNEILRILTNGGNEQEKWRVRMDLIDEDNTTHSHRKSPFRVSGNNYTMHVGNIDQICENHRMENIALNIIASSNASESSGWFPNSGDKNPWFRIDERKQFKVKGVFIRGQEMEYRVEYSYDNTTWENVTANRSRIKSMNLKSNTTGVKFMFGMATKTRYVRIQPEGRLTQSVYIVPIVCKVYSSYRNRIGYNENINSSGNSFLTRYLKGSHWCLASDDKHPWLQFELRKTVEVQGVVMNGGKKGWVTEYRVEYQCCDREAEWKNVTESPHSNKIFNGKGKQSTKVTSNFYEPIKAHAIRIVPTAFGDNDSPVMSVTLLGTEGDMLDKADKQPFSTFDKDNDGDEKNCASLSKQGWWYNRCRNVSQTEYSDENVDRCNQIVKVEFIIRRFP